MSDIENKLWYIEAQKRAQKIADTIDFYSSLQLEITQTYHDNTWYLHDPWAPIGTKKEREALGLKPFANAIDAYRTALNKAINGGYPSLVIYSRGGYHPRQKPSGAENINITHVDITQADGRIVKDLGKGRRLG